jgi:hypothetical protein
MHAVNSILARNVFCTGIEGFVVILPLAFATQTVWLHAVGLLPAGFTPAGDSPVNHDDCQPPTVYGCQLPSPRVSECCRNSKFAVGTLIVGLM